MPYYRSVKECDILLGVGPDCLMYKRDLEAILAKNADRLPIGAKVERVALDYERCTLIGFSITRPTQPARNPLT